MWMSMWLLVGSSKAPIDTPIQSCFARSIGSKNNEQPQVLQKPRRTFADDWYQVTFSSPVIVQLRRGTSVPQPMCPETLRHWVQWHASGGFRSPVTSIRTAPHMHEALRMARAYHTSRSSDGIVLPSLRYSAARPTTTSS